MRRALFALLAAAPLACAALGETLSDSAGRMVALGAKPERMLAAGPPAESLLCALAPTRVLGLVEAFPDARKGAAPAGCRDASVVPRLTAHPSEADLVAIQALHPDFILDFGDVNADYAAQADADQARFGAPTALFSAALNEAPQTLRRLGAALGASERGEALAKAAEKALALLADVAKTPDAQRVAVYYAQSPDGLRTSRQGSSLGQAIVFAGGRLVAPGAGKGAFADMTVEDIAAGKPQVVIVTDEAAAAPGSALRKALPPETRFYVDRGAPFPAMGHPPGINQLVGALALAEILYPDRAKGAGQAAIELNALLYPDAPKSAPLTQ